MRIKSVLRFLILNWLTFLMMYSENLPAPLQNIYLLIPRELFDVASFIDTRCKTSIEEIQTAVDESISPEQTVKLRQCLLTTSTN